MIFSDGTLLEFSCNKFRMNGLDVSLHVCMSVCFYMYIYIYSNLLYVSSLMCFCYNFLQSTIFNG